MTGTSDIFVRCMWLRELRQPAPMPVVETLWAQG